MKIDLENVMGIHDFCHKHKNNFSKHQTPWKINVYQWTTSHQTIWSLQWTTKFMKIKNKAQFLPTIDETITEFNGKALKLANFLIAFHQAFTLLFQLLLNHCKYDSIIKIIGLFLAISNIICYISRVNKVNSVRRVLILHRIYVFYRKKGGNEKIPNNNKKIQNYRAN